MPRPRDRQSATGLLPRMEARARKDGLTTYRYHPLRPDGGRGKPINLGTDKALAIAGARHVETGAAIRMDGAGIHAVRSVLEDYAAMLETLSERTMTECHRITERRGHEILRGVRQPHDVVVTAI